MCQPVKQEQADLQTKLSFSKWKEMSLTDDHEAGPQGNPMPIPTSVIPSDADHKTSEYRIAVVKYYHCITQVYAKLAKTTFQSKIDFIEL